MAQQDNDLAQRAGLKPQPGQSELVAKAYCDCNTGHLERIGVRVLHYSLESALAYCHGCSIGVCVELGKVAGAMVNPMNYHEGEARETSRRAALRVADALEEIARGIRKRAGN